MNGHTRKLAPSVAVVGLALVLACAPAAPSPTAPPAAKPAASPAPAKPAEAKPAAKVVPKAEAKPDWQQEWERTLAAAKQEGVVVVKGPAGVPARDALTDPFEEKYGIKVDFLGGSGRDVMPLVTTQRSAGQYLNDVYVGGTTTGFQLIEMGATDPLEPALILPDVKDPKNWRGGLDFVDEGRHHLVVTPYMRGTLVVNSALVNPAEFTTYKALLEPKWKGKIVVDDPRAAGPGQATFLLFFMHPELGADFIRALAQQDMLILKNYRQELDLVGQGRYPILLGTSDDQASEMVRQGVPIQFIDPRQLRELADISPANGAVALFNRAPHPNAAKVYLNWFLSKEGQTLFAQKQGYVSARVDVPTDHTEPWRVPIPGAIKTYTLEAQNVKDQLLPLLRELFPG